MGPRGRNLWFEYKIIPTGSYMSTLDLQLVVLLGKVVEPLRGRTSLEKVCN